jgi:hypothetical protein
LLIDVRIASRAILQVGPPPQIGLNRVNGGIIYARFARRKFSFDFLLS